MIIYGVNPVREAMRAHPARVRFIAVAKDAGTRLQKLVDEARQAGVTVRFLPSPQVDRMAEGGVHNGVAADISHAEYAEFDEIIDRPETTFVVMLDGVQDPQNFGAVLRVAEGFGANLVVIPEHDGTGLTAAAVKTSAGASEWLPVAKVTNLARAIEQMKKNEFWVYGAAADGDPVDEVDFSGRVAVVLGSEGKGIRRNVLEHCDRRIAIPMRGHVESFNVATAAAVLCYEVDRQRRRAGK